MPIEQANFIPTR